MPQRNRLQEAFPTKVPEPKDIRKKIKATNPNFRIRLGSVEVEFRTPVPLFFPGGLFFLEKHAVFHDQDVHLGSHETPVSVFRGCRRWARPAR